MPSYCWQAMSEKPLNFVAMVEAAKNAAGRRYWSCILGYLLGLENEVWSGDARLWIWSAGERKQRI